MRSIQGLGHDPCTLQVALQQDLQAQGHDAAVERTAAFRLSSVLGQGLAGILVEHPEHLAVNGKGLDFFPTIPFCALKQRCQPAERQVHGNVQVLGGFLPYTPFRQCHRQRCRLAYLHDQAGQLLGVVKTRHVLLQGGVTDHQRGREASQPQDGQDNLQHEHQQVARLEGT